MDAYKKCRVVLGQGGCSSVQLCRSSYEYVAVKKTRTDGAPHLKRHAEMERTVLEHILSPHRNVVALRESFVAKENVYLILEFLPSDLRRYITPGGMREREALAFLHDILSAVDHMHKHNLMHRDIKPSNVLLGPDTERGAVAKLSDFGLSMIYKEGMPASGVAGTAGYQPPEMHFGLTTTLSVHHVDIWGCGCLLGEMLAGRRIFERDTVMGSLRTVFEMLGRPTAESWPGLSNSALYLQPLVSYDAFPIEAPPLHKSLQIPEGAISAATADLMRRMLALDPEARITASEALAHRAFTDNPVWTCLLRPPLPTSIVQNAISRDSATRKGLSASKVNVVHYTPPPCFGLYETPPRRLFSPHGPQGQVEPPGS